MKKDYINTMNKIKLNSDKKDNLKKLLNQSNQEEKNNMKIIKFKPMAAAACMAVILVTTLMGNIALTNNKTKDNYFSVSVKAKELAKVSDNSKDTYITDANALGESHNGYFSYDLDFPVKCKGKNIDKIRYTINEGCFQISNPKDADIVIDSEKVEKKLDLPATAKTDNSIFNQYKSFTVDYDKQSDSNTTISLANSSKNWSSAKQEEYKKTGYSVKKGIALEKEKEAMDLAVRDLDVKCTVIYKDGTKETKDIEITAKTMKASDTASYSIDKGSDYDTVGLVFEVK
ncbi:MAG: hypothetical protein PHD70_11605 [Anaerostipes sp.]|nr:hypothetical protein [Anaerostipes sp.]